MICDNINSVHNNLLINEQKDGMRFVCKTCRKINIIRLDANGRCDNRLYAKVFKADTVQPGSNLYYKLHPEQMSLA
jgi:hypothetical protein